MLVAFILIAQQKEEHTDIDFNFIFLFGIFLSLMSFLIQELVGEMAEHMFISVNTVFKDIVQIFRVNLVLI